MTEQSHPIHVDWEGYRAAVWRPCQQRLKPIEALDPVALEQLLGIEQQKEALCRNIEHFLAGEQVLHTLLWGARGTGKSSLVKAVLNRYASEGLRLIEIEREALGMLVEIVDGIRHLPYRFLIYCDDLAFEAGDPGYRALKTALEGSIEAPAENLLFIATSNRRHLLPEFQAENREAHLVNGEVHHGDSIEEKIALADRFGLWLGFYPFGSDDYLAIIDRLFPDYPGERAELHRQALAFSSRRGSKSGRTARQFYQLHRQGQLQ